MSQQNHPLEFLAKTAIISSKDDISNRYQDGLIIKDANKVQVYEPGTYALSEQTQNIVHSLNSSRILQPVEDVGLNATQPLNDKPSRESLIEIRRY